MLQRASRQAASAIVRLCCRDAVCTLRGSELRDASVAEVVEQLQACVLEAPMGASRSVSLLCAVSGHYREIDVCRNNALYDIIEPFFHYVAGSVCCGERHSWASQASHSSCAWLTHKQCWANAVRA